MRSQRSDIDSKLTAGLYLPLRQRKRGNLYNHGEQYNCEAVCVGDMHRAESILQHLTKKMREMSSSLPAFLSGHAQKDQKHPIFREI